MKEISLQVGSIFYGGKMTAQIQDCYKFEGKEVVIDSREGHDDIVFVDGIGDVWASRLRGWAFSKDTPEEKMFTSENTVWLNWEYDNGKLTIIIED